MDCSLQVRKDVSEVDEISVFLNERFFSGFFCHFQKFIQRTAVQWVWSLLFPEWPVTVFFTLLNSADRPFGVKNTQSLCIMFLNFFASLSYAFPDLMTTLSKLGALPLWPPDVEILPQACPRTSLKWQCVYKMITCVESSVFVFHFSNWGLQLGCCQCTFGSVRNWVDEFNIVKYHLFNCRSKIFSLTIKFVLFSFFLNRLYVATLWFDLPLHTQEPGIIYPLYPWVYF